MTTIYPPEAIGLPVVGVGRFLTAEGVLGQAPTLVLGDTQTSPLTAIEQIRGANVPFVIFEVPTTFEGLYAKIVSVSDAWYCLVQRATWRAMYSPLRPKSSSPTAA